MAGEVWLDDDGKRIVDVSGKQYVCDTCPCLGCPYLEVTLANFDSSICCAVGSTTLNSFSLFAPLGMDGTYTLSFPSTSGDMCYYASFPNNTWMISGRYYARSTVCADGHFSNFNFTIPIRLFLDYDYVAQKVKRITLWSTGYISPITSGYKAYEAIGINADLGVAIPNDLSCTYSEAFNGLKCLTPGGTVTVNLA